MELEGKIEKIGSSFRGLWKNCYQFTKDGKLTEGTGWWLTFIYDGKYVETPECRSASEALDFALDKIGGNHGKISEKSTKRD